MELLELIEELASSKSEVENDWAVSIPHVHSESSTKIGLTSSIAWRIPGCEHIWRVIRWVGVDIVRIGVATVGGMGRIVIGIVGEVNIPVEHQDILNRSWLSLRTSPFTSPNGPEKAQKWLHEYCRRMLVRVKGGLLIRRAIFGAFTFIIETSSGGKSWKHVAVCVLFKAQALSLPYKDPTSALQDPPPPRH